MITLAVINKFGTVIGLIEVDKCPDDNDRTVAILTSYDKYGNPTTFVPHFVTPNPIKVQLGLELPKLYEIINGYTFEKVKMGRWVDVTCMKAPPRLIEKPIWSDRIFPAPVVATPTKPDLSKMTAMPQFGAKSKELMKKLAESFKGIWE
ncbi:MAG: hypothetical protein JKY94_16965 [Rhodobacteraceae bacterium]|nr:hypothetical protein [Paracoccaceae bacterium]